jgi:hypothetical protein
VHLSFSLHCSRIRGHGCDVKTRQAAAADCCFRCRGTVMSIGSFLKVCLHPKLGVVLVDSRAQLGLGPDAVRLFKVAARQSGTFRRDIVSRDLVTCPDDVLAPHRALVTTYTAARLARRKPYCPHCRRHIGSVDASLCEDCESLKCSCGACGCAERARRRKAA